MVCYDLNVVFTAESRRMQSRYFFNGIDFKTQEQTVRNLLNPELQTQNLEPLNPTTLNAYPYSPSNTSQKLGNDFSTQLSPRMMVPPATRPATAKLMAIR